MKTILAALVAITFHFSASATHMHNANCKVNCPETAKMVTAVAKNYEQKLAEIKWASDDKMSLLNYNQTMQRTLNHLEKQKHQEAIENLEAENAYTKMMVTMLGNVALQNMDDKLEDIAAEQRFVQLIESLFADTAFLK